MSFTLFSAILVIYVAFMMSGFHEVSEGYVGIYKRFGVLQKKLTDPGYHYIIPMVQQFIPIKVTIQTDQVTNVPCGTSNGTLVYFSKIEVVNKLRKDFVYKTILNYTQNYDTFWITDKIHHEINQFCSKHSLQEIYIDIFDKLDEQLMKSLNKDLQIWAPGVQILSVRVTKPSVPQRIRKNFQKMERLKVDYFIAVQKQKVKIQEQVTIQKKKTIKMESDLDVKRIQMQKKIDKKKNAKKMAKIEADIIYEKEKTKIETQFLTAFSQASLYSELYTDQYLSYLAYDALTSNTTFTFGDRIPNFQFGKNLSDNVNKKNPNKKKSTKILSKKQRIQNSSNQQQQLPHQTVQQKATIQN